MSQTATRSKKAPARRKPSTTTTAKKARRRTGDVLPGWADLPSQAGSSTRKKAGAKQASKKAKAKAASRARVQKARALDVVPSLRFGILTIGASVLLVLFLGHSYSTRATLDALQEARRDNERLRLTHQRLQGDVDRMTGPSAVMGRAASLGLEEGVAYGPTIRLND